MSEFVTQLTSYECNVNSGTGIEIPENEGRSDYGQISKGMSKSEVLEELGDDFLIVESSNKWCWNKPYDAAPGVLLILQIYVNVVSLLMMMVVQ